MPDTSPATKAILFRIGPFPIPNKILAEELPKRFPNVEFTVIDIIQAVKKRPLVVLVNLGVAFLEYGKQLLVGDFSIKEAFLGTTYFYHWVKRFANRKIKSLHPAFTFQTESLWDVSLKGCPNFIYTDHTHLANLEYASFNPAKLRHAQWLDLEKQIYANATAIFTRSSNITRSMITKYAVDQRKIVMVGAGSNFNRPNPAYRKDTYRNKEILFVGIDWKRKGGPELAEAFKLVLQRHPDAKLTIVGCTPGLGLANCTEVGRIPVESVSPYYEKASIFCLPTKQEPFGIVFIEALHYRLPIVATTIGAIPDFVKEGENGYLVAPEDHQALAQKLIALLDDPEQCAAMGAKGHELALTFYNWDTVTDHMAETIRSNLKQ